MLALISNTFRKKIKKDELYIIQNKSLLDSFNFGYQAFEYNISFQDGNPYDTHASEFNYWIQGYIQAYYDSLTRII